MRVNLNLTQKGLILVSVPLVSGLIFFIALRVMLSQAEIRATQAAQSRDIISKAGYLSSQFIDAGTAVAAFAFSQRYSEQQANAALQKYDEALAKIPNTYRELHALTENVPQQAAHVARLEALGAHLLSYFEQYRKETSGAMGIGGLLKGYQLRQRLQEPFSQELVLMTKELRQAEGENSSEAKFWQAYTNNLLNLGIVVNIMISLGLALFFSRSISRRLGILIDNTMRLAGRKDLNERLSGSDEIAHLDRVFHQMSDLLRAAEREKQEFVSMISHDLRTPLTSLQGTLALIADDRYGALSEAGKLRVAKAETSLGRLIKLINELLEIERLEAGMVRLTCKNVQVQSVIEQSIDSIVAFSEQHGIQINAAPTSAIIHADPERLVQVLVNLLSNAIKFSPQESSIHITVEESPDWLTVSVQDQGRGIPPQALKSIFDRFRQVKDSDAKIRSGAGLGLAISKSIVEAHQGEIGVISSVGKGSTFWFKLPASKEVQTSCPPANSESA